MKRDEALRALGFKRDTIITPALLRTAYKAAVLRTHPDRSGGSAAKFRAVQAARAELWSAHADCQARGNTWLLRV